MDRERVYAEALARLGLDHPTPQTIDELEIKATTVAKTLADRAGGYTPD